MSFVNQVCSLEIGKKLKDLGVHQSAFRYWHYPTGCEPMIHSQKRDYRNTEPKNYCAAFTVQELLKLLPEYIGDLTEQHSDMKLYPDCGTWFLAYRPCGESKTLSFETNSEHIPDAIAKALIYLIEKGFVKP